MTLLPRIALGLSLTLTLLRGASESLTSLSEIHTTPAWTLEQPHPVSVTGVVTRVDPAARTLVLQQASHAVAFVTDTALPLVAVGDAVRLDAASARPYFPQLPEYPLKPSQRVILPRFQIPPSVEEAFFMARYRCWLVPKTTGTYRFAIASDDTSDLLLTLGENPSSRKRIASVLSYTQPNDWSRTPSQRSEDIHLEAGRAYPMEVVHQQAGGQLHLSVAWEGPDVAFGVIPGDVLRPASPEDGLTGSRSASSIEAGSAGGVLQEIWTDAVVEKTESLWGAPLFAGTLAVTSATITRIGQGDLPASVDTTRAPSDGPKGNFLWRAIEGTVTFCSEGGDQLQLEVDAGTQRITANVRDWRVTSPTSLVGRRVSLEGVYECDSGAPNNESSGRLWTPSPTYFHLLKSPPDAERAKYTSLPKITARLDGLAPGDAVRVRGRIRSKDGRRLVLANEGTVSAQISEDGRNWNPLGDPIEMALGQTCYVGFAVNSHSPTTQSRAIFDNLEGLDMPLKIADIGTPPQSGRFTETNGRVEIVGCGSDIWDAPDQFTFVYGELTGERTVTARLGSFLPGHELAKAGLMLRQGLERNAPFIDLIQTGYVEKRASSFQWRSAVKGTGNRLVTLPHSLESQPTWLRLTRTHDTLAVTCAQPCDIPVGSQVEVIAHVNYPGGVPELTEAVASTETSAPVGDSGDDWRPVINVATFKASPSLRERYDFFGLRGVVTFCDRIGGKSYWAIQDDSGGLLLPARSQSKVFSPTVGSFVEVLFNPGWAPPGSALTPDIVFAKGRHPLPRPLAHPMEQLLPRRGEGSWIQVEGTARAVQRSGFLELKSKGEIFSVAVSHVEAAALAAYVNAVVRVRGVIAYPSENDPLLLVPGREQIEVITPATDDPFDGELRPLQGLDEAANLGQLPQRIRVRGELIYNDGLDCYLQDGPESVRIQLTEAISTPVGTKVEVAAFVDDDKGGAPLLRYPLFRPLPRSAGTAPVDLGEIPKEGSSFTPRLIRVRGELTAVKNSLLEMTLAGRTFRAILPPGKTPRVSLPPGSVLELTGVGVAPDAKETPLRPIAVQAGEATFTVRLRTVEDITLVQRPPLWLLQRTAWVGGIIGLCAVVAVIWIQRLRRRVRVRTAQLAAAMTNLEKETRLSATLAERDRLAGEIHDSVEQGLNGLVYQLDTITRLKGCAADVTAAVGLARNMVTFTRTEVKHAVWELQAPLLENTELPVAISKLCEQIAHGRLHFSLVTEGEPRRLSPSIEHHLLRIAQEALNNCVKHAQAHSARVTMSYTATAITLRITDDGKGLPPNPGAVGTTGHFGLISMRSRANKLHGTFTLTSTPGQGTTVEVVAPLQY